MKQVSILSLNYGINFHDADDGDCYAGEGKKIISVHQNLADAEAIVAEYQEIVSLAEEETTVFPIQRCNAELKKKFGFILHDIDDGYDFKLKVETFEVE